jgi:hypothetical protein
MSLISTPAFFCFLTLQIMWLNSTGQGCCSGGSGSPIAGGASQGVLQEKQAEASLNYQYLESNRFYSRDSDTSALFNNLFSNYIYARLAYGLTDRLTMSVESGYFFNKTQVELKNRDTIRSSGIADLILFPRYSIVSRNTELTRSEITLGVGYKLPLGKHNDSNIVYRDPKSGREYYTTSPPTVQPTNGSNDLIFYTFLFRGYPEKSFRLFANGLYIRKGWNSLGQKFGDFASVGVFAGQTFFRHWSATLQVRAEWIAKMKADRYVDMIALYNVYPESTGSKKIFVAPQLGFSNEALFVYLLGEFPIYQYLNGTQVGSELQLNAGVAWRFFAR